MKRQNYANSPNIKIRDLGSRRPVTANQDRDKGFRVSPSEDLSPRPSRWAQAVSSRDEVHQYQQPGLRVIAINFYFAILFGCLAFVVSAGTSSSNLRLLLSCVIAICGYSLGDTIVAFVTMKATASSLGQVSQVQIALLGVRCLGRATGLIACGAFGYIAIGSLGMTCFGLVGYPFGAYVASELYYRYAMRKGHTIKGRHFRYLVLGDIQRPGGRAMGRLSVVYNPRLSRQLVLKTYDTMRAKAFADEAHIWLNLGYHQFIAEAAYLEFIDNRLYIATEYVPKSPAGRNCLADYLDEPLPLDRCLLWASQIATAMEYAFEQRGLVAHGDIKPSNVLITPWGRVKVTDFGVARASWTGSTARAGTPHDPVFPGETSYTDVGQVGGTPEWQAPELLDDSARPPNQQTDIYSFGIVVWQMVAGSRAAPAVVAENSIPAPTEAGQFRTILPPVNSPLQVIIARCTENDPEKRYRSFTDILKDLSAVARKSGLGVRENIYRIAGERDPAGYITKHQGLREIHDVLEHRWHHGRHDAGPTALQHDLPLEHFNRGTAFINMHKMREAIDCFSEALHLDSDYIDAYESRATCYYFVGLYREAINDYTEWIRRQPRNYIPYVRRSQIWLHLGDVGRARADLMDARTQDPNAEEVLNLGRQFRWERFIFSPDTPRDRPTEGVPPTIALEHQFERMEEASETRRKMERAEGSDTSRERDDIEPEGLQVRARRAVDTEFPAQTLVEELRRRWTGYRTGRYVIDEITLTSSPSAWPPVIRVNWRAGDKRRHWEVPWNLDALRYQPLESAAEKWMDILGSHMSGREWLRRQDRLGWVLLAGLLAVSAGTILLALIHTWWSNTLVVLVAFSLLLFGRMFNRRRSDRRVWRAWPEPPEER